MVKMQEESVRSACFFIILLDFFVRVGKNIIRKTF